MKRRCTTVAALLTAVLLTSGCAAANPPHEPRAPYSGAARTGDAPPPPANHASGPDSTEQAVAASPPANRPATPPGAPGASGAPGATDPKNAKSAGPSTRAPVVIYQGDVKMLADEDAIPKTIDRVIDIAESAGGHLATRKDAMVQVKVPSAAFRDTLTKIDELGGVVSRSVNADDVSEEFHDLEVRLANLRTTQKRLQEFMARATNVNEMLTVERELERVAQEIDRIQGRLEFLRVRAAMSTITVALSSKPKVAPIVSAPSSPPRLRAVDLPIAWVSEISIDKLLTLRKGTP